MLRTISAFLAAPVPGALLQAIVVALWPKPGLGVFANPASMFVAFCLLIYGFALVPGVPVMILLRRRRLTGLRAHALAGLGVVLAPIVLALLWTATRAPVPAYVAAYNLGIFGLAGLLGGTLFWAIARPDRHAAGATADA